jgi:hypothetical protein
MSATSQRSLHDAEMSADHVRAGHAGINLAIGLIPNDTPSIDEMRSYIQSTA